jgi:hypothetical protein
MNALALVNIAAKLAGKPILIYIGDYDQAVSTDEAIRLSRENRQILGRTG